MMYFVSPKLHSPPLWWLRLKCEELGSRYRMPSKAEIAKVGGDDDREDKERVMAGFLSGSEHWR